MNIASCKFEDGEVYLFHPSDPDCPAGDSLWGVFDRYDDGVVRLESMTCDMRHFVLRQPLPDVYRHCRIATRAELADYMTRVAFAAVGIG